MMIGLLRGRVLHKQPPFLLLDVNGVGYELEAPMSTFYALPLGNDEITLYTHLTVREDAHILYGFSAESDRALFRALLKVNGVGGKMALGILSGMTADEFAMTVSAGDVAAMTKIPGVGKKTAERLIIEMRDRMDKLGSSSSTPLVGGKALSGVAANPLDDAMSALMALGYKAADVQRMTKGLDTEDLATEEIIRLALQSTR
jgi:Holliday junction DNA helicase RuvA